MNRLGDLLEVAQTLRVALLPCGHLLLDGLDAGLLGLEGLVERVLLFEVGLGLRDELAQLPLVLLEVGLCCLESKRN